MKSKLIKSIALVIFLLVSKMIIACSCWPYEPNFYKNITKDHHICMAVFDTMRYNSVISEEQQIQTGYFVLLDTIGSFNGDIGDTLVVYGQDGLNCGEWMEIFEQGDTLLLALDVGYNVYVGKDTFTLNAICGSHFLKFKNGGFNKLSFTEAKQKITYLINSSDERCSCSGLPPEFDFYFHVKNSPALCMAQFINYSYSYSYEGRKVQTGYFLVLDSIKGMDSGQGDTIVILGEDGINCGEMLNRFSKGDTMFLALSKADYAAGRDTFYLKGGTCGYQYLKLENKMNQGLTASEVMDKIESIITGVNTVSKNNNHTVYPNPTKGRISVVSENELICKIDVYNIYGKKVLSINHIHQNEYNFSLQNLAAGIYHIAVRTDKGFFRKKIIRQ